MSDQLYDLHIRIPLSKVATIIEVLQGEGTLLSVIETKQKTKPRVARHKFNGAADGTRGIDIITKAMTAAGKGGTIKLKDLERGFAEAGRNYHSVSPLISGLLARKKLTKIALGTYKVISHE